MNPEITLAMIVKDGAKTLARCLESVQGLVSHIVIVDTGSSDESIEIAKKFGAEVHEIPWPGAFDEARNAALTHVKTEWVLSLDADEWIEPESAEIIRIDVMNPNAAGFYLIMRDYDLEGNFSEQVSLELWRHRPGLGFQGVLHETIQEEALRAATGLDEIPVSEARFCHDGYAIPATKEKELAQIELIKRELEIRPNQLSYMSLLCVLQVKHDISEGFSNLKRLVQMCLDQENEPEPPDMQLVLILALQLSRIPASEFQSNRTMRIVRISAKWFHNSPLMLYAMVELEKRRNNLRGAHQALCRIADMATTGNYSRARLFDPQIFGAWLWSNLCVTASKQGQTSILAEAAKNWLKIEPENESAKAILASIR